MPRLSQKTDMNSYNPKFKFNFCHPRYWGTWLVVFIFSLISFLPITIKRFLATQLAKITIRVASKANIRARVNLDMCLPEKTQQERETIIYNMYITAIMFLMTFPAVSLRNKKWLENNTVIKGYNHIEELLNNNENIIFLLPHTWAIDIPAILLASKGHPVAAVIKQQKNPVSDWLMHKQRMQYGGRILTRDSGIRPFINSIRKDGYLGYYLPDEDLGRENSVFVKFFATQKATISGLGRLSMLSKAKIVPIFSMFNCHTGKYELDISPALPFPTEDEYQDARIMNECIEQYVSKHPEQYMWILRLLKSRPDTEVNPYRV